ncbi:MAG: glutathione S-transferase [Arenicella sp.]|jgi:glutathione S-transferase
MGTPILFYSPSSPYARKVLVHMYELGIVEQYQIEAANPLKDSERIRAHNPLGKIPTLVTQEGELIADSRTICHFLVESELGREVAYTSSKYRTFEAVCDGVMDSAYLYVMEKNRQDAEQSEFWKQRWIDSIESALNYLENNIQHFTNQADCNFREVALGCALGYLDFRLIDLPWRDSREKLASWFVEFSRRPSMIATIPADLT